MKTLYVNGVDTGFKVKNAEHAVYGADTEHLFEHVTIEDVNDSHDDAVFINVYDPRTNVALTLRKERLSY